MEYDFTEGPYGPEAHFSMGHEALAYWLTQEVKGDTLTICQLLATADQLRQGKGWDFTHEGAEYDLLLTQTDAIVTAHSLNQNGDFDLEDDLELYDDESAARCGLEDFEDVLKDWLAFVTG
ncbi:MAG: YacL family protein [Pontibacterium sp.]